MSSQSVLEHASETTETDPIQEIYSEEPANESSPLLHTTTTTTITSKWKPPPGFYLIQVALFSNVFLNAFDSTITASTWARIGSDFQAANSGSWLTTSYLITASTFQPLYGRFSDILGRRAGFLASVFAFALGSVGCAYAPNVLVFCAMRLVQGIGGAGLSTMATIVNSDMIPFRERGMYQAMQNVTFGFGSICGASLGGWIADGIGWRWCFLLQVPLAIWSFVLGFFVVKNPASGPGAPAQDSLRQVWRKLDLSGAAVLICGLAIQLVGLSLGGNELRWSSPWVIATLCVSSGLLACFIAIEAYTSAIPIVPLRMFRTLGPVATQLANVLVAAAAYAFIFMIPLYFQVVLEESATKAGARLIVPSLGFPVGGVLAGYVMSRYGHLSLLVRCGAALMVLGNALVTSFRFRDAAWKYVVFLFPANVGQGLIYPSILFTFMSAFDHADHAVSVSTVYLIRSLGGIYGVAISSLITQNTLTSRLPAALSGMPDKRIVIDAIRHSVDAIYTLPPEYQVQARMVYYEGIRYSFTASTALAAAGLGFAFLTKGKGLKRKDEEN